MEHFGAFIGLDGAGPISGLLHVSNISRQRVEIPAVSAADSVMAASAGLQADALRRQRGCATPYALDAKDMIMVGPVGEAEYFDRGVRILLFVCLIARSGNTVEQTLNEFTCFHGMLTMTWCPAAGRAGGGRDGALRGAGHGGRLLAHLPEHGGAGGARRRHEARQGASIDPKR